MFISVGCDTEDLHELNINPQAVDQIDVNYLFTAAELSIAANGTSGDNRYTDWRVNIGLMGGYIQQLSNFGGISATGNFYRHNEESAQAIFEFYYNDQLKNLAEMLKQTGPGGFAEGKNLKYPCCCKDSACLVVFPSDGLLRSHSLFRSQPGYRRDLLPGL
jgi:hypothetical protein